MISIAKPSVRAEDHIGLVRFIAAKYVRPGDPVEDSDEFGNGMFGLAKAVRGYDGRRNFSTYATPIVTRAIIDGLRKERRHRHHSSLDDVPEMAAPERPEEMSTDHMQDTVRRLRESESLSNHVQVFLYYHTVCRSWRKVGERFGIPKSTAQFWAQQVLSHIRVVASEVDVDMASMISKIRTRRRAAVA